MLFHYTGENFMFKSSFSKYLIAFVAIILISFLMLSGIVTSMIRNYSTEEKRQELESSSSFIADLIADQIEATDVANILEFLETSVARSLVTSMIRLDPKVEIVILDQTGRVLIHVDDPEIWSPNIDGAFVSINRLKTLFPILQIIITKKETTFYTEKPIRLGLIQC